MFTETIRNAQALFDILLADRTSEGPGTLKSEEKGLLDRVLYAAYREKGITTDRQTHTLAPPLLRDIHRLLRENCCGKDPTDLAARLERFVSGSLAGLFRGPTNVVLDGPAIIMDTSDLDPELRPITLFLLANYIWTISFGSRIPRHLFIDELFALSISRGTTISGNAVPASTQALPGGDGNDAHSLDPEGKHDCLQLRDRSR